MKSAGAQSPTAPLPMNNLAEIVDRQNSIIQLQSETINELFRLLEQHLTMEELEKREKEYLEEIERMR